MLPLARRRWAEPEASRLGCNAAPCTSACARAWRSAAWAWRTSVLACKACVTRSTSTGSPRRSHHWASGVGWGAAATEALCAVDGATAAAPGCAAGAELDALAGARSAACVQAAGTSTPGATACGAGASAAQPDSAVSAATANALRPARKPARVGEKEKSWIALPTIAMHLIVQAVCSAPMPPLVNAR